MYLCYMDESGDTGVSPGSPTPTYTVAAVLVHETHWVRLFEDLIGFRRYLRGAFGLRMRAEIKATQLIRGSGPWSELGLGEEVRKRIYRSLLRFQGKSGGVLTYAVVVDKSKRASPDDVRDRAWRFAFQRIERTMNDRDERVMLMPDSGQYHWIRKLAREMRRFSMPGSMLGTGALERPMLKVLIDDPVERESHESYFIQLADLNAYAAYRDTIPHPDFPAGMWQALGPAILEVVNMYKPQQTPGIVLG
jgi:hypothetical protein